MDLYGIRESLFYGGLDALIGNPKTASLFKEMEKEHCHSNDSWLWFACHGPSGRTGW